MLYFIAQAMDHSIYKHIMNQSPGRTCTRFPYVPRDSAAQLVPMSPVCSLRVGDSFFGGTALEQCMLEGPALTPQQ